jgi:hypothetical protein
MNFDGNIVTDPVDINSNWKDIFSGLYSPSCHSSFKESYKTEIQTEFDEINGNINSINGRKFVITENMTKEALKSCKTRKACGVDKMYYENFMHGGQLLIKVITKLFNHMTHQLI